MGFAHKLINTRLNLNLAIATDGIDRIQYRIDPADIEDPKIRARALKKQRRIQRRLDERVEERKKRDREDEDDVEAKAKDAKVFENE
jgi:hypothetical protein